MLCVYLVGDRIWCSIGFQNFDQNIEQRGIQWIKQSKDYKGKSFHKGFMGTLSQVILPLFMKLYV